MRNTTPGFPRVKADFEKQINDLISDDNKINEIITRLKSSEDYPPFLKVKFQQWLLEYLEKNPSSPVWKNLIEQLKLPENKQTIIDPSVLDDSFKRILMRDQKWFITIMQGLNYKSNEGGICYGLAHMTKRA